MPFLTLNQQHQSTESQKCALNRSKTLRSLQWHWVNNEQNDVNGCTSYCVIRRHYITVRITFPQLLAGGSKQDAASGLFPHHSEWYCEFHPVLWCCWLEDRTSFWTVTYLLRLSPRGSALGDMYKCLVTSEMKANLTETVHMCVHVWQMQLLHEVNTLSTAESIMQMSTSNCLNMTQ